MESETTQLLVAVLGAGGGGAVLLALINGLIKWLSGASSRERQRNTDLNSQKVRAIEQRDKADEKARIANEYSSALRRQLFEAGVQPLDWPDMDHLKDQKV